MDMDKAIIHCTKGISIWDWASNDESGEPDVVMASAGDIPSDLHVVGLVGKKQASWFVATHQLAKDFRIGRITANDAVRTELENVADSGDRSCGVGLEWSLLQPFGGALCSRVSGIRERIRLPKLRRQTSPSLRGPTV